MNNASALRCFRNLIFEEGPHFLDDRDFFLFFLSMTFSPVDRVCHAYIKYFFVFVPKKVADVTDFRLNSRKSLRKANSLLGYFRAFWLQSGIAERRAIIYVKVYSGKSMNSMRYHP
jgi:hypothetical protein